jgi:hypothetical protein
LLCNCQLGNQIDVRSEIHDALGLNLFFHSAIYTPKSTYLNFEHSTPPQLASALWSSFRLWQLKTKKWKIKKWGVLLIPFAPWPISVRQLLNYLQKRGAFMTAFKSEE